MHITKAADLQQQNISQAFTDLLESEDTLRIFTKDGNLSLINRNLIRFTSPLVNSILSDVPCCSSSMVFIPDVSKVAVDHVLSIVISGFSDFNSVSIKQIQEVQEAAKMLKIDLTDLDYVKKNLMVDSFTGIDSMNATFASDTNEDNKKDDEMPILDIVLVNNSANENASNISVKSEVPESNSINDVSSDEKAEDNLTKIKTEYSETIHGSDSVNNASVSIVKSETFLNNKREMGLRIKCETSKNTTVLLEEEETKNVEKNINPSEANIYPGLALTPPPEQIYSPFKIPLKKRKYSVETGPTLEEKRQELDNEIFAPTPPPEIQNTENLSHELPFYPTEMQSSSPQKEILPENEQQSLPENEQQSLPENEQVEEESSIDLPSYAFTPNSKSRSTYLSTSLNLSVSKHKEISRRCKVQDKHSPIDALAHQAVSGPPRSKKPELQYIYRSFFHDKCGERHSRVDYCAEAAPHKVCGKKHSYFKKCDGSWMRVEKLEEVAMRWPNLKMKRRIQEDDTIDNNDEDMTAVGVFVQPEHRTDYFGPPISTRPEIQYVYESFLHVKCGKTHRRVDLCDAAPPHNICGRKHSYAMECNGSWMTVEKFEMMAMKWPTTKTRMEKKTYEDFDTKSLEVPKRKRIRYDNSHITTNSNLQKPYKEMSEGEKRLNTCMDWNFGQCLDCKFGNRKRHRCSKMVIDREIGERICWGDHREVEHESEYRDDEDNRRKKINNQDWDLRRVIVKTKLF